MNLVLRCSVVMYFFEKNGLAGVLRLTHSDSENAAFVLGDYLIKIIRHRCRRDFDCHMIIHLYRRRQASLMKITMKTIKDQAIIVPTSAYRFLSWKLNGHNA